MYHVILDDFQHACVLHSHEFGGMKMGEEEGEGFHDRNIIHSWFVCFRLIDTCLQLSYIIMVQIDTCVFQID